MMSDRRSMNLLLAVAAVNGVVCIAAPVLIVTRSGQADAPVGLLVYLAAVAALALTPVQLAALWLVLRRPVRDMLDRRRIEGRVARVLEDPPLETAFQPIVDIASNTVLGVEALARFSTDPAAPPDVWFAQAERIGRGLELEILAIRTALEAARELPEHLYVAVNASPCTVMSPQLLPVLLAAAIPAQRIVIEITEHSSVDDYPPLLRARAGLRDHGVRVAVDDAGSGYSSFRHIVALAPDIIKIDRALIAGIDKEDALRAMVGSLVLYAFQSGTLVVGEGVETAAELETLALLGVDAVQGYLLGRPTTRAEDWGGWRDASLITSPDLAAPLRPMAQLAHRSEPPVAPGAQPPGRHRQNVDPSTT